MKQLRVRAPEEKVLSDEYIIHIKDFDADSVKSFHTQFVKLNTDPEVKAIPIMICSYGGDTVALFGMLDIMKTATKPIATIGIGASMSCGAVLLASGTKGYRFAGDNLEVMIHEVSGRTGGKNTDIVNDAKSIARTNRRLLEQLSKAAGRKDLSFFSKELKRRTNVDWYLTAKECLKLRLVDHVGVPHMGY